MVNFLVVLLAGFFSLTANAAVVPSGVPQIGLGAIGTTTAPVANISLGQFTSSTQQIFSLYASGTTASNFFPLYKNGTAYRVPNAVTAYCFNIRSSGETGGTRWQIVSDTSAITYNQSTALAAGLFQGGASAQYVMRNGATANVPQANPGVFTIAQNRYMAIQVGFSANYEVSMDCYEQ